MPAVVEGKSLRPVIEGRQAGVREWLFCAYRECQRMIRDDRWKLIQYHVAGKRNTQLFDLDADPDELNNLADNPNYAAARSRLHQLLQQARQQFGDPVDFDSVVQKR